MANDANVWAREYLTNKGFTPDKIGYDNSRNMVTAGGLDFFQAPATGGKAMGSQSALDAAFANMNKSSGQNAGSTTMQTQTNQPLQSAGQIKSSELMAQLEQALNKPFEIPTFSFNAGNDPRYLQAMQLADQSAVQGTGNVLAGLAGRGIENSSIMGDRAAQIQAQERGKVTGQLLPQMYAQAYDQFANELGMKYQANQDQMAGIANLLGIQNTQNQQGLDNRYREKTSNLDAALQVGNATGKAVSPQDDWTGLFRQAGNANTPQNFAGNQFEYGKERDQVSDEQWKSEFDQRVKQDGLANAVSWYNANTSRQSSNNAASNSSFNRAMDVWKATGVAPAGIPGVAKGTPYSSGSGGSSSTNNFESTVISGLQNFGSSKEAQGWLRENAAEITKNLGADGYKDLQDMLPSFYGEGKDNSANARKQATEAAMKDYRWKSSEDAERKALIDSYMQYYQ